MAFAVAAGVAERADPARPGDRLRQDGRAQPRAAAPARRARRARPAGADRHLAQVVPGRLTGRDVEHRLAATIATNVLAYMRGASIFRVHEVAPVARRPRGGGCYGHARDDERRATTTDERRRRSTTRTRTTRTRSEPEVTIEISGLSLFTHVGVTAAEREVGQRLLLDLRLDVGECDATVTDRIEDTVDYAEVCEQREPGRPAAHLQDARAAVCGDRRPAARSVRRAGGLGQGGQARAAARAAGERGVGRGLARGRVSARGISASGSNVGERRANLEAAVDEAAAPRRDRARLLVGVRDRARRAGPRPARLPQRLRARSRPRTGPRSCSTPARRSSASVGRAPGGARHGPRVIDVDVLLLGELEYPSERLTLPHAEVRSRRFVLVPLLELDPDLTLPGGERRARRARGARRRGRTCGWPGRRCPPS